MFKRLLTLSALSFFTIIFAANSVSAAKAPTKATKRIASAYVDKSVVYSFQDEARLAGEPSIGSRVSLGSNTKDAKASPGIAIGNTWYDLQHNGTIGRMVAVGPHSGELGDPVVHFGWTYLPGPSLGLDRAYAYANYNAGTGLFSTPVTIQPGSEYGGFVNVDVTPDNRAVVGGHNDQGSGNQSHFYFALGSGGSFFSANSRIPDAVARTYEFDGDNDDKMIWPKFKYQYGSDTVMHVIASQSDPQDSPGDPSRVVYFRKVGLDASGTWTAPLFVDTNFTLSPDIVAERNGDRVAIVWMANPGTQADPAATGVSVFSVQIENTILYRTSDNQGLTWNPTVNLQPETWDITEPGTRPYADCSALFDTEGYLHILWSGRVWGGYETVTGTYYRYHCRLLHWSENIPSIRTVANGDWYSEDCGASSWNLNIAKMQVTECDNKLYAFWIQFNDVPNGVIDDCAARASIDPDGAANGELFASISDNGGLTWDEPHNLTNTYTPNCDPSTGYNCESEMWPSVSMYGHANQAAEDWSGAAIVDPSGTYTGDYFLDVMYINDKDPGAIAKSEGTWQLSNIFWFRMACIEPISNPVPIFTYNEIDFPAYTKPGTYTDTQFIVQNLGNTTLTYTVTEVQDNGPAN